MAILNKEKNASKKSVFDRLYGSRCDCKKSHEEVTETAERNLKI